MTVKSNEGLSFSPFSISLDAELQWDTLTYRESPVKQAFLMDSEANDRLLNDLSIIGIIGSAQCSRVYYNMDKKKVKKAIELRLIKKHNLVRNKQIIPIYTLGSTGMAMLKLSIDEEANKWKLYKKHDVLQRLAFYQLYGKLKEEDPDISLSPMENDLAPFLANIERNGKSFAVCVVRGNENEIKNFFRFESDKLPDRILFLVEYISHLKPINDALKPFLNRIRVTTDFDLKEPFEKMFFAYHEHEWQKEYMIQNRKDS